MNSEIITCISIKQPWAWAILNSDKNIENRTWKTKYRGKLYIHASKGYDKQGELWIKANPKLSYAMLPDKKDLIFGAIIGSVDLVDTRYDAGTIRSPWALLHQNHWVLEKPEKINPIYAKGKLGLWDFEINN